MRGPTLMPLASVAAMVRPADGDTQDTHDVNEDENARPPRKVRLVVSDESYDAAAQRWLEEENP